MTYVMNFLTIAIAATLILNNHYSEAYNSTIERRNHRRVDIIELMLPHHAEIAETESDKSERIHSEEKPRYEIFIKPNKSGYHPKGTAEIKIFVETENYGNENNYSENKKGAPPVLEKDKDLYPAVPLSIKAAGPNEGSFQNTKRGLEVIQGEKPCDGVCLSGKRASLAWNVTVVSPQTERKTEAEVQLAKQGHHAVRGTRSDDTAFGGSYISRDTEKKRSNPLTKQEALHGNVSYKASAPEGTDTPRTHRTQHSIPVLHSNSYSINTTEDHIYDASSHHAAESEDDASPSVEKILVYEPGAGISATQVSLSNPKRFAQQSSFSDRTRSRQPAHDLSYSETVSSSGRRLVMEDEVRSDGYHLHEHDEQGGNRYFDTSQPTHPSDSRRSGSSGSQFETSPIDNEKSHRPDSRGYRNGESHGYVAEPDDMGGPRYTGLPYETVSDYDQTRMDSTTRRPVRDNTYLGFPDSYTPNMYESSRPTSSESSGSSLISICSSVFKYTKLDDDRWFGEVYVTTGEVLNGMRLDITLSKPADLMTAETAEIKTPDNVHFTVLSLKKRLVPGVTETVELMVKYSEEDAAPVVQKINLNGRLICPTRASMKTTKKPVYVFPGDVEEQKKTTETYMRPIVVNEYATTTRRPPAKLTTSTRRTTTTAKYASVSDPDSYDYSSANRPSTKKPSQQRPSQVNPKPPGQNRPQSPGLNNPNSNFDNRRPTGANTNIYEINPVNSGTLNRPLQNDKVKRNFPCGLPAIQPRPLITNGQMSTRGQWPWHAALYKNMGPNLNYSCGGTLITDLYVVTAAHCVTESEYSSTAMNPKMLHVHLGKYHLYLWSDNGMVTREVSHVVIHPNYNSTDFRSDIAVLTLSSRVDFTDFIRPVCLWDKRNTRIDDIVGLLGTVVGWGFDTNHQLSKDLRQAQMPVVSYNVCLLSYPDFFAKFTSNTTFCAGFKNGTSVCNGDSGGGMFFPISVDGEERWFLRGLVSLSPAVKGARICDTAHYVVFTDIAKYLPWLEDIISRD